MDGLKQEKILCHVLEARSSKSGCLQAQALLGRILLCLFCLLVLSAMASIPWLVDNQAAFPMSSQCPPSVRVLLHVQIFPFHKDTSHTGSGPT